MKVDWSPLTSELAHWRRAGLSLSLWWRDDDAVAATPALTRISDLANDLAISAYIAVIPDRIEASLAPMLMADPRLIPVIHGWQHLSHAPKGAKNAEFGHMRDGAAAELDQAFTRMHTVFGSGLVPLFVPPWNRIADGLLPALSTSGCTGLSTYGARQAVTPVEGLVQINTHIDPIFWRGHRGLVDPDELVAGIVATLHERRSGEADIEEPLGLLTHHLVHNEDVWEFTADVLRLLLDEGAVPADIGALLQAARKPSI